jgi:hypothetical protein
MRILTLAALAAAIAIAGTMATTPAEAARKKRAEYYTGDRVYSYTSQGRPRTRIAVRPRSYLDAGTEVLPGERKYREYATPYGYSALEAALGPTFSWDRRPFNNPFDVPLRYGY